MTDTYTDIEGAILKASDENSRLENIGDLSVYRRDTASVTFKEVDVKVSEELGIRTCEVKYPFVDPLQQKVLDVPVLVLDAGYEGKTDFKVDSGIYVMEIVDHMLAQTSNHRPTELAVHNRFRRSVSGFGNIVVFTGPVDVIKKGQELEFAIKFNKKGTKGSTQLPFSQLQKAIGDDNLNRPSLLILPNSRILDRESVEVFSKIPKFPTLFVTREGTDFEYLDPTLK